MTPGVVNIMNYKKPTHIGSFFYPAAIGCCNWGFSCWQPIFFYGKDPYLSKGKGSLPDSIKSSEVAEKNGHPCPKPIKQWSWLVKRISFENETILDCLAGSGTTGVVCELLNRKWIMIEKEKEYCDIAINRIKKIKKVGSIDKFFK